MPFLTSNGANVHIDVGGRGTNILFTHELTLDHRQWSPQRVTFEQTHRVLRLDARGHGRSASAGHGHSWDRLAEDVQRAIVQAGFQRLQPGFLVGHSWSADAVLQTALAEPRLLKGVVVASPAMWGMTFSEGWNEMLESMRARAREGQLEAALELFRNDEIFAGVRAQPDLDASIRAMQSGFSGDTLRSDEQAAGETTLDRLGHCKIPVLVIRPALDREDFKTAAHEIAARAPRAHIVEIDDAGHFANLESPDAFNRILRDFFQEHE